MDLDLEVIELSKEEQDKLEYEEKLENGEIKPIDQPLDFYLEKHPNSYHLIRNSLYVIVNELNVNKVKEFIDGYENGIKNRLIELLPHLADPTISQQLDDEFAEMVADVVEMVDLNPDL